MFNPFEKGMDFVFQWEGRFTNDPKDPGGATNYGITLQTARDEGLDVNGDGKVDVTDIRLMTPEIAMEVYKEKYWNGVNGNNLDWPLGIAAFDTAVNVGVGRTNRWLQDVEATGGDYMTLLNLRMIHYLTIIKKNPSLRKYKNGWVNRITDLKKMIEIMKHENN